MIGDGIGAEVAESVKTVFKADNVPIEWEQIDVTGVESGDKHSEELFRESIASLKRNKLGLKGNDLVGGRDEAVLKPCKVYCIRLWSDLAISRSTLHYAKSLISMRPLSSSRISLATKRVMTMWICASFERTPRVNILAWSTSPSQASSSP